jgi:hemolysin activation/secretion protein
MTLLKLSPGAQRLRRIAKAHAAGELPADDYRRIRGEVIDAFVNGRSMAVDLGDDTEQRWTVRGTPTAAVRTSRRTVAGTRPRIIATGILLLILIVLGVGARPLFGAVQIPPVAERDPNPFTSPRIPVETLAVRNLPEFPHLGIDDASVNAFLQQRLSAAKEASAPGDHGFTDDELEELARLMDALGVHAPGAALSGADAAEISALIQAQKSRRGLSLIELEALAAELGRFYRTRGLPLAVAFVPVQAISDGTVELEVLPGVLAGTRLSGRGIPADMIERAFAPQMGADVEAKRVESVLYRINDLPGLRAEGTFVAGDTVGTTILDLNVDYERAWHARARVDNHGSDATGEVRTLVEGRWHSPLGRGDWLSAGLVAGWRPANTTFGFLEYKTPYRDFATELGARAGIDAFDWSDGDREYSGHSRTLQFSGRRQLQRRRERSTALDLAVVRQTLRLSDDLSGMRLQDQSVYLLSAGASDERLLPDLSLAGLQPADVAMQLRLELDAAWLDSSRGIDQSTVARLGFDAAAWRLTTLPWFGAEQKLRLALSGQFATGALPGTLQRALGGPGASAGFAYPTLSADAAVFARLDMRFRPALLREAGEIVIFADAAHGSQDREFSGDVSATLVSAGVGWENRFYGRVSTQVMVAWPMADSSSGIAIDDNGPNLLLLLEYRP